MRYVHSTTCTLYLLIHSHNHYVGSCGRAVKAIDLKSIGIFPHRFKYCQLQFFVCNLTLLLISYKYLAIFHFRMYQYAVEDSSTLCTYMYDIVVARLKKHKRS